MKYVIDSNILINMKHFYPEVFKSLWDKMNDLVTTNEMISVKEAYNEITARNDFITEWADIHKKIFSIPEAEEYATITEIMTRHKELVRNDSVSGGKAVADPFLIAKAKATNSILVTNETFIVNAHKIPNVCQEYNVKVMNLKEFMINEGWQF
jgi:hypothetical protein